MLIRSLFRVAPALQYPGLRLLMTASTFESIGFMGEQVIVGWLALELTNNPVIVGAALAARSAPLFALGLIAGTIADMVDRRTLMRFLNIGMTAVVISVGGLILTNNLQVWHIFAFSIIGGCMAALYQTARQSFTFDVVGAGNLISGMAYVGLGMRLGGLLGALAVGFLTERSGSAVIAIAAALGWEVDTEYAGAGAAYLMLAVGYIIAAVLLSLIRSAGQAAPTLRKPTQASSRTRSPVVQNLIDFVEHLRHNTALMILILMVASTEILGFSSAAAFPNFARDVLGVGAAGLGIMTSFRSVGAVGGILILTPFREVGRKGAVLVAVVVVFGAALMLLGQTPLLGTVLAPVLERLPLIGWLFGGSNTTFLIALSAITIIGAMMALSDVFSQSLMQSIVPNEQRGRAMGAWVVSVGMAPVGNLQVGWIVGALGVGVALTANGIALAAIALVIISLYGRLRRM